MKKLETVLAQLSDLYEFNKKLKSYKLQKQEPVQDRKPLSSDKDAPARASSRDVTAE